MMTRFAGMIFKTSIKQNNITNIQRFDILIEKLNKRLINKLQKKFKGNYIDTVKYLLEINKIENVWNEKYGKTFEDILIIKLYEYHNN